jgi:hypothetical protein
VDGAVGGGDFYLCRVFRDDLLPMGYHFNLVFYVVDLAGGKYNPSLQMDAGFLSKQSLALRPVKSVEKQEMLHSGRIHVIVSPVCLYPGARSVGAAKDLIIP